MSQQIRDSIYARLTETQTPGSLYAAVEGRIYESVPPVAAVMPHLVYIIEADEQELIYGGIREESADVVFEIHGPVGNQTYQQTGGGSPGAAAVGAIEELLHTLMHGASLACTGRDRCLMVCTERGVPSVDGDGHLSRSRYRARATAF